MSKSETIIPEDETLKTQVASELDKAKQLARDIIHCAEDKGLLLLSCGTYDNTVRWIPPLNVSSEQINDGLRIFEQSLKEVIK